jgi:chitinase
MFWICILYFCWSLIITGIYVLRALYLMAKSYAEKQKWAATLEAISSSNVNSGKIKDIQVFGNIICRLSASGNCNLDVLCTWPVSDEVSVNDTSFLTS